jgi:SAM-dependent methyltransferase
MTTDDGRALREQNRQSWNRATAMHQRHRSGDAALLRAGGSTLFSDELALLGELRGLDVVHLQCNTGRDTLSLANLGARVTGVDLSDTAIDLARALSEQTGIPAHFARMDVYDWLDVAAESGECFDVAFCSYGAICWLADLDRWASGLVEVLRPGGRFVTVDFHPVAAMFDDDYRLSMSYGGGRRITSPDGVGDYVGASGAALATSPADSHPDDVRNPHPCHLYAWGLGEIVSALAASGLTIKTLREYLHVNGERCFPHMRPLSGHRLTTPAGVPAFPLMYGIVAQRA